MNMAYFLIHCVVIHLTIATTSVLGAVSLETPSLTCAQVGDEYVMIEVDLPATLHNNDSFHIKNNNNGTGSVYNMAATSILHPSSSYNNNNCTTVRRSDNTTRVYCLFPHALYPFSKVQVLRVEREKNASTLIYTNEKVLLQKCSNQHGIKFLSVVQHIANKSTEISLLFYQWDMLFVNRLVIYKKKLHESPPMHSATVQLSYATSNTNVKIMLHNAKRSPVCEVCIELVFTRTFHMKRSYTKCAHTPTTCEQNAGKERKRSVTFFLPLFVLTIGLIIVTFVLCRCVAKKNKASGGVLLKKADSDGALETSSSNTDYIDMSEIDLALEMNQPILPMHTADGVYASLET